MTKDLEFLSVQKGIMETPSDLRGLYSDGFHTFDELYEVRMVLNATLFNEWANLNPTKYECKTEFSTVKFEYDPVIDGNTPKYNVHKSKRHFSGEECFGGGWFIVCANLPSGQISFHYEIKYWDLFKIPEFDKAQLPFDGHTTQDVINRLKEI